MTVEASPAKEKSPRPWSVDASSRLDSLLGAAPKLPRPQALDADRRATIALWTAAVLLVLLIFRAGFPTPGDLYSGWDSVNPDGLAANLYWASWGYLLYLAIPLAIVLFVFRESPARYGLRIYLTRRTALLYIGLILMMMPLLFWASSRDDFQRTYPFVKDFGDAWVAPLLIWEFVRATRFICLEFFFRGYLLFSLEEKLGYGAIAASTLPYGLIHYAKPFPEAMGAICAGAILGFLALRTRTVIGGAIIHGTIAVSMDLLALWRTGFF
jgi:membrane protease YdiL (CAAX protease family)